MWLVTKCIFMLDFFLVAEGPVMLGGIISVLDESGTDEFVH